jgi:hypothetical protein
VEIKKMAFKIKQAKENRGGFTNSPKNYEEYKKFASSRTSNPENIYTKEQFYRLNTRYRGKLDL